MRHYPTIFQNEKSKASKEKRAKNVYNHHLGNTGYAGLLHKRLNLGVSERKIDRSKAWLLAHMKKNGSYTPDVQQVVKRISELKSQVEQETFQSQGRNDIISEALQKKPNRIRLQRLGQFITPSMYFNIPDPTELARERKISNFPNSKGGCSVKMGIDCRSPNKVTPKSVTNNPKATPKLVTNNPKNPPPVDCEATSKITPRRSSRLTPSKRKVNGRKSPTNTVNTREAVKARKENKSSQMNTFSLMIESSLPWSIMIAHYLKTFGVYWESRLDKQICNEVIEFIELSNSGLEIWINDVIPIQFGCIAKLHSSQASYPNRWPLSARKTYCPRVAPLSKRQVQQFLGIINYIRDFIPHVDHYTHHLLALLKKKPPEWNADHTIAVTTLKQITQNPPPLKLITDGKRILQTDASDESWGAILLEDIYGKEHFIAYASGQFSDTQKHYHSVFKEILAVKNGIKKFEYHLIGHHFLIRMDSSAFPNILNFKGLTLDPFRETTEDVLWYIWCLIVLYATKLVLPITPTLEHLLDPDKATSLTWTLLEWFSPIPWWRKKLQQLSEIYNLERMPASEAQMFTSVFIIHRPYFQHPDTKLFWTQDQVYEWFTAPHLAVIENEIQSTLHNYLCQLNHQTPSHKDIFHTSLGPHHDSYSIRHIQTKVHSFPNRQWMNPDLLNQDPPANQHYQLNLPKLTKPPKLPLSILQSVLPETIIALVHHAVVPPLYKRPSSFTRSIRTLISTRRPQPKEYIQSSRLDQCALQATSAEQYVTLEIPSELLSNWKREGYTHLHLEGIRLILTLHGRKGLPVIARLALLDTRFKQYQDTVIGTVLTTLHAGSVLLTFYPNFNLSLQDPNLPTTLKVQVQIQSAEQIYSAKIATLHHQLVYRLQNHALDLPTPEHHFDTLMVLAESDQIPTIIQILRQIPRHELIKLMPLEWISNYEQFHNNTAPIQTSESMFERRQDGTVRMTFQPPPSAPQEPHRLSFTYSSMITAVQTAQEDLPITGFTFAGYPICPAKHSGHFLWDAPGSGICALNCPCWDDWEEDDDYATTRKKKPKKKKPPIAKHCKSEIPSRISNPTPPLACMMFSSTSSDYSSSFPPLDTHIDSQRNVVSKPFISSPITSSGHLEPLKPFESILNWQTQNARAQNDTLISINSKVEKISLRTEQLETQVDSISAQMQQIHQNLQSRIAQLDYELQAMLAQRYYGPEFDQKEREIRRLKAELDQIESEKQRPTIFTTSPPIPSIGPTYHPFASMLSPIRQYDPSKLFGMTHTLFRDNPLPPPPKPKPKAKPQPRPVTLHPSSITIPGQHSPGPTPASLPVPPPPTESQPPSQSKDKQPMHYHTKTDTESLVSTSDSEKSYADITRILMAQPDQPPQGQTSHTEPYVDIPSEVEEEMPESSATNQPPPAQTQTGSTSQKLSNGPWFTFDDLPSHKWRDRLNEMFAWIDLQMLRPEATTQSVLREFATRFTGALRD
ncbi:hypothetical protein KPL70_000974 [Citrus sinensis]|nr:hypothetical protein KPL70_000974 [Citrus sinensis]